ncbi:hypothetical protein Aph02nite_84540 [Actinoplanes philippinensis]|uniref:Uncharacterized protein n=1 Tax=Actinoplanes philippinensis TaxID=35752 RepID=A0A1I2EPY2_9ACTN|nr:hypothetical protein [Actinoplanes philippinensis]GIE82504.1 hypothetical protein Aph02nite_84540 [Actinoplanes philippinensis]SFE94885.1 hypothetical protein SAMN05421541_104640 [Actinoplanes philippinensis]
MSADQGRPPFTTVCIVSAAVAVAAYWGGLLVVVGTTAVPGWAAGAALLLVALAAGIAGRWRRRAAPAPPATGARRWRWVLSSLTVLGCLTGALADAVATYHPLKPADAGGCRAVARETAFLFAGSGEVYAGRALGPISVLRRSSSWTADDGYQPIAAGAYRLTWAPGGGSLVIDDTGVNPVWPALHEVDCG